MCIRDSNSPSPGPLSGPQQQQPSQTPQHAQLPPLHKRVSHISIAEDSDRIILHDGDHNFVLEDEDDLEDQRSNTSVESYTLRERQDAINETHPFGIRIWKPALYKKQRSVQRAADEDIHETKSKDISVWVHVTNFLWSITIGVLIFLFCSIGALFVLAMGLFTSSARDYALLLYKLGCYFLWPFGKVVYMINDENYLQEDKDEGISVQQFYKWVTSYSNRLFFHESQTTNTLNSQLQHPSYGSIHRPSAQQENVHLQRRLFGRGKWTLGRFVFYTVFHIVIQPLVFVLALITWLIVFTIPMSNIMWNLMYHCRRHPLALDFKSIKHTHSTDTDTDDKNVLLCTFRCAGWHYYKFTVDGTNVIVMNLVAMVIFTIFDFYVIKGVWHIDAWFSEESAIFFLCLVSIIPLAFYIGQAVASISAQTSMGLGAVINAFFSTIVEIFLYCVALQQSKGLLVEGSMICLLYTSRCV